MQLKRKCQSQVIFRCYLIVFLSAHQTNTVPAILTTRVHIILYSIFFFYVAGAVIRSQQTRRCALSYKCPQCISLRTLHLYVVELITD